MKKVGYIRVSTKDQNPDRQYHAMKEHGIQKKKHLYGQNFREKLLKAGISKDDIKNEKRRFAGNQKH